MKTQFVEVLNRLSTNQNLSAQKRSEVESFTKIISKEKPPGNARILFFSFILFAEFENEIKNDKAYVKLCKDCANELSPKSEIKPRSSWGG